MAIFGYGRVSTTDQTTENQRLEIETAGHAIQDGFWFADTGISGATKAMQRPQFKALLDRVRPGETLVVSKLDRLGRDAQDVNATIKDLADRHVKVVVLQIGGLDLTSPAGKLLLTMLAAVAQLERDMLIERTNAGLARARKEGKALGRPAKTTPKQRTEMTRLYASGESVSALARTFKISRASVLAIVKPSQDAVASPTQQSSVDATLNASKSSGKPAAANKGAVDLKLRTTLKKKGQHRPPGLPAA